MAKLSRRASSSASTPTTTTVTNTRATATSTSSTTTATRTAATVGHAVGRTQQQLHRVARASSSSIISGSNSNQRSPQLANFVDPDAHDAYELPHSAATSASPVAAVASPAPSAYSSYSSNSNNHNSNTAATSSAPAPTHAPVTATPYMPLLPPGERNLTDAENAAERARIREQFFATYDVMTGVRIAATLGGFFGLMVFLIVWKSRSSSNETLKVLKDPKMAAVAAVCMQEEEERELQEAIVATGMSIYPDEYDALVYRRQRMLSLGNVSAPPLLNRGYRCASVGGVGVPGPVGYNYLLEPPRRFSYSAISAGGGGPGSHGRRKSGSESSRIFSNYPMGGSFGTDDYFMETEDELEHEEYMQRDAQDEQQQQQLHQRTDSTRSKPGFLSVPMAGHDSRRSSAMTCCSTDSSYLERRTSAYTLGMSNLPPTMQRKLSTASRTSSIDNWDYYYPDIQVIQPTPKASPCPSERSIHDPSSASARASASSLGVSVSGSSIKRKHSIVSYDPESAQAGRKQQIHSISADTVDVYPYNQTALADSIDLGLPLPKPVQSAPPISHHQQAFNFSDSPTEELRLGLRRKLTLVELQRNVESNNNSFPYTANAAVPGTATATATGTANATATSSSISVDSTPVSLDRLNGSLSLGTISAKVLANVPPALEGKRAPLASLSSFKISSLECPDSELRSLDEDSVFGLEDSAADTDDDMQQLSSDSEEQNAALTTTQVGTSAQSVPQPYAMPTALPMKRLSLSSVPMTGVRPRRPLLQRHRTISATSNDHALLPQPQPVPPPLETHFGAVICSPPQRRAQLLQQHSDPQTATTTTTTTTTTTEDDTCSTLNTELGMLDGNSAPGASPSSGGGGGGESATHTQYSSLNTVISVGPSSPSPQMDNNFVCSSGPTTNSVAGQGVGAGSGGVAGAIVSQLPTNSRLGHDPCTSSISDSVIATQRPQTICMPSSLKDLILRGGGASKSAHNLSLHTNESPATTAVMLELPLIRLPTDDDDDDDDDEGDAEELNGGSRQRENDTIQSVDPSLPGTSRKWSKETLF